MDRFAGGRHRGRPGPGVPAVDRDQQPRAVRAPLRLAVLGQPGGRRLADAGDRHRLGAAAAAGAPGQVRQPVAAAAGGHLRDGRRGAGAADLHRLVPVRVAQHRDLVRREGRRGAGRRPEPRPRHAGRAGQRPGHQDPPGRRAPGRQRRHRAAAADRAAARAALGPGGDPARPEWPGLADRGRERGRQPGARPADHVAAAPGAQHPCAEPARRAGRRHRGQLGHGPHPGRWPSCPAPISRSKGRTASCW